MQKKFSESFRTRKIFCKSYESKLFLNCTRDSSRLPANHTTKWFCKLLFVVFNSFILINFYTSNIFEFKKSFPLLIDIVNIERFCFENYKLFYFICLLYSTPFIFFLTLFYLYFRKTFVYLYSIIKRTFERFITFLLL